MKARMICCVVVSVLLLALAMPVLAANPPVCPHVIGWTSTIGTWAQGAPWIKVIYAADITPAKATGAKVFYRPYDADNYWHDDGALQDTLTGTAWADAVWAKISGLAQKPDAVGYRNEFAWGGTAAKRTCAEFVNYKNRLVALGYTGKVIFGSFGVGWVDSYVWDDVDCRAATDAADGIEVHEYFDLTVACCTPWLCFRHRDIAIADHPDHLGNKEWYIGEFGSDHMCGNCTDCDDDQCRTGWNDRGKLSAQAMIDQCAIYRAGCADQVVAVFLFQQGAAGWTDFEVMGTSVATWMQTTWGTPSVGAIAGNVKDSGGANLSGATVSTTTGGYSTTTNSSGNYTLSGVTPGTYSVVASKSGYNTNTQTGKTVTSGQTTTVNFTLTTASGGGTLTGNVKNKDGINISGATVSTSTGGYSGTTNSSGNYTISNVAAGTYSITASKSGYVGQTKTGRTVTAGQTTNTNFPNLYIAQQLFDSVPGWTSSFDASWGSAATWSSVTGGQAGNCLQASRGSQGSSSKVIRYSVPANTNVTISVYMKCPSNGCSYWAESAFKLGDYSATDFDNNSATWIYIKKFSNTGTNGNGNVWTKYSATVNTGSNTYISVGYKHGASGCTGPTVQWDTFLLD